MRPTSRSPTSAPTCGRPRRPPPPSWSRRPRTELTHALDAAEQQLRSAIERRVDIASQRLDQVVARVGRPSARLALQQRRLGQLGDRCGTRSRSASSARAAGLHTLADARATASSRRLVRAGDALHRAELRLQLLDPRLVLQRGYALLVDADGAVVTRAAQTRPGQSLRATLAEGEVDLTVSQARLL
jgi:exodeoxyribonuclease VII large subunit